MAASVSSERAFSQGGITISKRRSRLKGDIVEALQCVKCAIRSDLLFREAAPSSHVELEPDGEGTTEDDGSTPGDGGDSEADEPGWDEWLIDDEDMSSEGDAGSESGEDNL
jgi:hypothetical protein